jgi:6-phosphogluconolactonase
MTQREIKIFETPAKLFEAAAQEFISQALEAIRSQGVFSVALSGGSTPKSLYSLLASDSTQNVPWDQTRFFWSDERHVPPDHPDSNFRMAYEAMLSKVPVPAGNIFRVHSEDANAELAAAEYEQDLYRAFKLAPGEFPRFDLILLGIGPDGHTASLFPETTALKESKRLVVANWVEKFNTYRITFTLPVLNAAACVMFLVTGNEKGDALQQVFSQQPDGPPAKMVRPANGRLLWLLDRAAAAGFPADAA